MAERFLEAPFEIDEKYAEDYRRLKKILEILRELGLTPKDYPPQVIQAQWEAHSTIPIAEDGVQGIRITRLRKGGLKVSFTNGFEDPRDQERIRITEKLREEGFDVA